MSAGPTDPIGWTRECSPGVGDSQGANDISLIFFFFFFFSFFILGSWRERERVGGRGGGGGGSSTVRALDS